MKLILVNQRYGHTRTIVIRGWMKGLLSLCLIGAPVALGYLGYELALADTGSSSLVSQKSPVAADELIPVKDAEPQALQVTAPALTTELEQVYSPLAESESFNDPGLLYSGPTNPAVVVHSGSLTHVALSYSAAFQHGRVIDPAIYLHQTLY